MFSYVCVALVFVAACNAQAASNGQAVSNTPDAVAARNNICKKRNAYYKVDSSCDSYVECIEYVATDMTCPDGLHYNINAAWPNYPCGYPMDVPCQGRGTAQPAQPTADCPHQYGYFPSPSATDDNCGQYRMCVAGQAMEMVCPTGLAFNPDSGRCDWPYLVPSCKADAFLGFTCPPAPVNTNGEPLDTIVNYKYQGNCYYFFSCQLGHARLLSCDNGLAFDPAAGRCVNAELVNCNADFPTIVDGLEQKAHAQNN